MTRAIVSKPDVMFGQPCIEGTRVPTSMIGERWAGGDTIAELAADYALEDADIVAGLRFEMARLQDDTRNARADVWKLEDRLQDVKEQRDEAWAELRKRSPK